MSMGILRLVVALPRVLFRSRAFIAAETIALRQRLVVLQPTAGTPQLYSGEAAGLTVQFPGWQYPVVADMQAGGPRFDNYQGRWWVDFSPIGAPRLGPFVGLSIALQAEQAWLADHWRPA